MFYMVLQKLIKIKFILNNVEDVFYLDEVLILIYLVNNYLFFLSMIVKNFYLYVL
jgi:hypothetical protein